MSSRPRSSRPEPSVVASYPHRQLARAISEPSRTSAMHVARSSSATIHFDRVGRRRTSRRNRASAQERVGRRHHRSHAKAGVDAAAAAQRTAPSRRQRDDNRPVAPSIAVDADAISADAARLHAGGSSAPSASARIDSYEPCETTTWRWSLAVPHTTTATRRGRSAAASRRSRGPTAAGRHTTVRASRRPAGARIARRVELDDPARIRRQFNADGSPAPLRAGRSVGLAQPRRSALRLAVADDPRRVAITTSYLCQAEAPGLPSCVGSNMRKR